MLDCVSTCWIQTVNECVVVVMNGHSLDCVPSMPYRLTRLDVTVFVRSVRYMQLWAPLNVKLSQMCIADR